MLLHQYNDYIKWLYSKRIREIKGRISAGNVSVHSYKPPLHRSWQSRTSVIEHIIKYRSLFCVLKIGWSIIRACIYCIFIIRARFCRKRGWDFIKRLRAVDRRHMHEARFAFTNLIWTRGGQKCSKMTVSERIDVEQILGINRGHFKWVDFAARRFHIEGRRVDARVDILLFQDLWWSIQANKFGENVWV